MIRDRLLPFLGLVGLISLPPTAQARTLNDANSEITQGADYIVFGCVSTGTGSYRTVVCVHDTIYEVSTSCTLDENVYIYAEGGADSFIGVQDANLTEYACGTSTRYYKIVSHGGYVVEFYGGTGDDVAESSPGCTRLYGGDGNDELYQTSSCWTSGDADDDQLVCDYSGEANDDLLGGTGDDCLWDQDPPAHTFDCGTGGETWHDQWVDNFNPDPPSCETRVQQCGFYL